MNVETAPRLVAGVNLDDLVDVLLRADPDILEIVLFGSAAYAPDLARDVDLLILTQSKRDMDVYWDAIFDLDLPLDVDVVPKEPGEKWGNDIALSVNAVGISLYGNQAAFEEAEKNISVPTYDDARFMFHVADQLLDLAHNEQIESRRHMAYQVAFNGLFDAARNAVMTFLVSENSRWGQLARELPKPFETRFREIISVLHIQYHYQGTYPKETADQEYYKWRATVNQFIDDLERETQARQAKSQDEEKQVE